MVANKKPTPKTHEKFCSLSNSAICLSFLASTPPEFIADRRFPPMFCKDFNLIAMKKSRKSLYFSMQIFYGNFVLIIPTIANDMEFSFHLE